MSYLQDLVAELFSVVSKYFLACFVDNSAVFVLSLIADTNCLKISAKNLTQNKLFSRIFIMQTRATIHSFSTGYIIKVKMEKVTGLLFDCCFNVLSSCSN